METIYGESTEIQIEENYSNGGGISLFSVSDEGDTITGGSGNDGSYPTSTRIRWTVTRYSDDSEDGYGYIGGISGDNGWYTNNENSPFFGVEDEEDIARHAFNEGNLQDYFDKWNEDQSQAGQVKRATFALLAAQLGCSTIIGG